MPDMSAEFNRFFRKEDLTGPLPLTIAGVEKIQVGKGDDAEDKWTVFFEEDQRGVTLNKSRQEQLTEITGSTFSEKWIGKRVHLVVDPNVKFGGKKVGGLAFEAAA